MSEVTPAFSSPTPTPAPATSALDLFLAAFAALTAAEQEEAIERCQEQWLASRAGTESETGRILASLRRVRDLIGETPGIEDYKRVRRELIEEGEELVPVSRITRHFDGSWHLAREAVALSETSTARLIEKRFRQRRLGKVWRYTEATLKETLARCVADIGHVPQVAEFDWWRQRQLELASARGEELHLPSATPYRRRWGSWEAALVRLGYTSDEVAERLERGTR